TDIVRVGNEPSPLRGSLPSQALPRIAVHALPSPVVPSGGAPSPTAKSLSSALPPPVVPSSVAQSQASQPRSQAEPVGSAEDAGWFSLQVESDVPSATAEMGPNPTLSEPPIAAQPADAPVAPSLPDKTKALPFSAEITPSVDRLWDALTEGVFKDSSTLQGVGMTLPAVDVSKAAEPVPEQAFAQVPTLEARREELDALANALTGGSPSLPVVHPSPAATQVMAAVALPAPAVTSDSAVREPPQAPLVPGIAREAASAQARGENSAKPAPRSSPAAAGASAASQRASRGSAAGWLVKALLAFAVSYAAVSYYKATVTLGTDHSPGPTPTSSR
ncbi:MAG: hypothetical protein ABJB12_03595, partial [Pseudomonadota bacterium]